MSKLIIIRPREWVNRSTKYKLILDGIELDTIKNDEIKEFNITAGRHTLKARMNWMSSREYTFDLKDDEIKYLKLSVSKRSGLWRMAGGFVLLFYMFVIRPLFKTEQTVWETVFHSVLLFFALILLYDITLGRKSYLNLRENDK